MHDSTMALTGLWQLLGMMINGFFGGCGVGLLNYFIYLIIAVFISGLMVGRTPEFLGHKVEAREVKIAALITLLKSVPDFGGYCNSSLCFYHFGNADWAVKPSAWLNNPGYHGFSECCMKILHQMPTTGPALKVWAITTSFGTLHRFGDDTGQVPAYHWSGSYCRFACQKEIHARICRYAETDTVTFGLMTFAVILGTQRIVIFPCAGP
jgi:K+-transporting ATPase ATPase A chain